MSITVSWADNNKTIVFYTIEGAWTWDDWEAAFIRGKSLVGAVNHLVDGIIDARHSGPFPPGVLPHIKQVTDRRSPNLRLTVLVTQSASARTLYNIACRVDQRFLKYYALADSLEDALHRIAEIRKMEAKSERG